MTIVFWLSSATPAAFLSPYFLLTQKLTVPILIILCNNLRVDMQWKAMSVRRAIKRSHN